MNEFFRRAGELLGYRQKAYQSAFAGSHMQMILVDLANYSRAFDADAENVSEAVMRRMQGRRDVFFRIIKHLKLTPGDLEAVYQPALVNAAKRIQGVNQDE